MGTTLNIDLGREDCKHFAVRFREINLARALLPCYYTIMQTGETYGHNPNRNRAINNCTVGSPRWSRNRFELRHLSSRPGVKVR